ncbi:Lrp/AsnC family transcriptional regulator [Saccharolobus solfataricus]|jgi:DNA-binding Lrp family transcriptional regulator|uniref:Transcription regulator, putative n=6 Tax=Saccharolobus TaxID=2100760 RepID=Q97W40_SACS2|nr:MULTISPECIES: Lrp/AsnC ligand binding domain-containing protein [Sulfolobaceae]AAK42550.1 Transcription regulator, putative [Saccharolobus solfataricus P2]ACP34381.1 regulatory protein AsnC/Lrp family [Sulfolobus islandicus L.S.2.15]ACP49705.1 regulatory protein AsnC/Lrp family [Sulfolobus islandicus Y.N.15.51]ADB85998.1 regulatory protein, AsnC/Lrp family [Sulfolobus islandicus L.D.8.5]AKA72642.1 Lrp/AsnC family transcriptional regulator [Saccharolobus solfataricus]
MAEVVRAYILVSTTVGKEMEVADMAKKVSGVIRADPVYGEYDVVVEVEAKSSDDLKKVIYEIRRNPNIIRTVTLIVM